MAWPTITGTGNLDSNIGSPIFARADILKHVQDTNSIITEFDDVDLTGASDNQLLAWDGSKWGVSDTTIGHAAHMRNQVAQSLTTWSTTSGSFSVTHDYEWNNTGYVDPNRYIHPASPTTGVTNPDIVAGTYDIKINGFQGYAVTRSTPPGGGAVTAISFSVKLLDTDTPTTIVSMTPDNTGHVDRDYHTDSNEHYEAVYTAMAARHTFSSTTNIKLQATLSLTVGTTGIAEGYYLISSGLLSRFIKI